MVDSRCGSGSARLATSGFKDDRLILKVLPEDKNAQYNATGVSGGNNKLLLPRLGAPCGILMSPSTPCVDDREIQGVHGRVGHSETVACMSGNPDRNRIN